MTSCDRLHDYALDELSGPDRTAFEQHLASCAECAMGLGALELTTAALRAVPDREIPQRIAFVSDKIFKPSPWSIRRFLNGGLGFASACVLAAALVFSAYHRTPANNQPANNQKDQLTRAEVTQQIDTAVTKAVAQVRDEDARTTEAALKAADERHAKEYRDLMVSMDENMSILEKRMNANMLFAANDAARFGARQ